VADGPGHSERESLGPDDSSLVGFGGGIAFSGSFSSGLSVLDGAKATLGRGEGKGSWPTEYRHLRIRTVQSP
jgi:hypothetical protein